MQKPLTRQEINIMYFRFRGGLDLGPKAKHIIPRFVKPEGYLHPDRGQWYNEVGAALTSLYRNYRKGYQKVKLPQVREIARRLFVSTWYTDTCRMLKGKDWHTCTKALRSYEFRDIATALAVLKKHGILKAIIPEVTRRLLKEIVQSGTDEESL